MNDAERQAKASHYINKLQGRLTQQAMYLHRLQLNDGPAAEQQLVTQTMHIIRSKMVHAIIRSDIQVGLI